MASHWPVTRDQTLLTIGLFLLGFLGLAISLLPFIVPPKLTIWQAANAVSALQFALVGYEW